MNWSQLWINIFGTTTWANIDIGFWLSMGISLIIAIIMNIVFWSMKPYDKTKKAKLENKDNK